MIRASHFLLLSLVFSLSAGSSAGQQRAFEDIQPPRPKKKLTKEEKQQREALKVYARACRLRKENQLIASLKAFEKALKLDPDSVKIRRAIVPLYIALDRRDDAIAACKKALELDPDHYEIWWRYAQQLYLSDQRKEAREALNRAIVCKSLQSLPDKKAMILGELGQLYDEDKAYEKAEIIFRQVVEILQSPAYANKVGPANAEKIHLQLAETWERIGQLALNNSSPERALAAFDQARKHDETLSLRFYMNLAEIFYTQKKSAKALEVLKLYLVKQPQQVDGYELKIKILKQMDRQRDILPELTRDAARDRHNVSLQLLLARELQSARRFRQAEVVYDRLKRTSPTKEVFSGIIDLKEQQGEQGLGQLVIMLNNGIKATAENNGPPGPRPDAKAAHARHLLSALHADREAVRKLLPIAYRRFLRDPSLNSRCRALLGSLAWRTRQLDVAEAFFESCLYPDGRVRQDQTTRNFADFEQNVYFGLLSVLRRGKQKQKKILEICDKGLKHAQITAYVLFHLDRSQALMDLNRPKEALAAAKKAVESSSDQNRLLCLRSQARILLQSGEKEKAIKKCKDLLKEFNDPKDIRDIRYTLSGLYSYAGDKEKSAEQLQAILDVDPNDATANNDLGYLWADMNKNLAQAEKMIRKALRLDREQRNTGFDEESSGEHDNAAFIDSLGWVLFRKGQLQEAIEQLEKAVSLPDGEHDPVLHDHLGDVYFRMKKKELALKYWRLALKLYSEGWRKDTEGRVDDINKKIRLAERAGS